MYVFLDTRQRINLFRVVDCGTIRIRVERPKLEVVPIIGMGGIGKTTLARHAYDDQLITEHFEIRAWVTVSQDYSVGEIVSNLLASAKVFTADSDFQLRVCQD